MLLETILQKSTFNLGRIQQRFLFHESIPLYQVTMSQLKV